MITAKMSGDCGDCLYGLTAVRGLGGVDILYLNPDNTVTKFSRQAAAALAPLLEAQPYIGKVEIWEGEEITYDLDRFRKMHLHDHNLADAHLEKFGLPLSERDTAWLTVENQIKCDVLFARSARYHNPRVNWRQLLLDLRETHSISFVGLKEERDAFASEIGEIPWLPTNNFLDLARYIAGCNLFVGNQSSPFAVAEGLKVNRWLEYNLDNPNCLYPGNNVRHMREYP